MHRPTYRLGPFPEMLAFDHAVQCLQHVRIDLTPTERAGYRAAVAYLMRRRDTLRARLLEEDSSG